METTVKVKYLKQSASKVRFVLKLVKDMQVDKALNKLNATNKKASIFISKAIKSGISNLLQSSTEINQNDLFISNAFVNEGPTMKRFRPAAMGRATRILKRSSHLTITIKEQK